MDNITTPTTLAYSITQHKKHKWTINIKDTDNTDTDTVTNTVVGVNDNDNNYHTQIIYKSILIPQILPMSIYTPKGIFFTANTTQPLSEFLTTIRDQNTSTSTHQIYNICIRMIVSLVLQLKYLHNTHKHVVYGFNLNDIIVINHSIFLLANPSRLVKVINSAGTAGTGGTGGTAGTGSIVRFETPFYKPMFCCPEIQRIRTLPATVSEQATYYSIGDTILHIFKLNNCTIPLRSKLDWFVQRSMDNDPTLRTLIYI